MKHGLWPPQAVSLRKRELTQRVISYFIGNPTRFEGWETTTLQKEYFKRARDRAFDSKWS